MVTEWNRLFRGVERGLGVSGVERGLGVSGVERGCGCFKGPPWHSPPGTGR